MSSVGLRQYADANGTATKTGHSMILPEQFETSVFRDPPGLPFEGAPQLARIIHRRVCGVRLRSGPL